MGFNTLATELLDPQFGRGMHLDVIWVDLEGQGHRSKVRVMFLYFFLVPHHPNIFGLWKSGD